MTTWTKRLVWLAIAAWMLAACENSSPAMDAAGTDASGDIAAQDHVDVANDLATQDRPSPTDTMGAEAGTSDVTPVDAVPSDVPSGADAADGSSPACTFGHVLVATSDYASFGGFITFDLATRTPTAIPTSACAGGGVDEDHYVRTSGCTVFDLEDTNGTVSVLNPPALLPPSVVFPSSAASAFVYPYDVAVISPTKAYVLQNGAAQIAIVNPATGATVAPGTIDLSIFQQPGSTPGMSNITVVGTRAYVSLQQFGTLPEGGTILPAPTNSHVAVIDTGTDALVDVAPATQQVDAIQLTWANPVSYMPATSDGRYLVVAEPGGYNQAPGGVDVIDLTTNGSVWSWSAAALGGDPSSVDIVSGTTAWATIDIAVDGGAAQHAIVEFDIVSGAVARTLGLTTLYQYTDIRRAPDGTMWSVGADYDLGTVHAFSVATGAEILPFPYTVPNSLNTTSIDFMP